MTNEQITELLAVGRKALSQALRQWEMYVNDRRYDPVETTDNLGAGGELEDRAYRAGMSALGRLGAAADELADASKLKTTAEGLEETFTRRADNARAAKYEEDQSKWWAIGVEFAFREAACAVKARRAEIAKQPNAKLCDGAEKTP